MESRFCFQLFQKTIRIRKEAINKIIILIVTVAIVLLGGEVYAFFEQLGKLWGGGIVFISST